VRYRVGVVEQTGHALKFFAGHAIRAVAFNRGFRQIHP